MASRRKVMGGLVAVLLPALAGAQAEKEQAKHGGEKPAPQSLSSSLGVAVYPSKGQSASKQQQDEAACLAWGEQQSGVNPLAAAQQSSAAPAPAPSAGGSAGRGAAAGAVGGTAVGVLTGHPARGAAIGATEGAIVGGAHGARKKEQAEQQAQAEKQAEAQKAQQERASFDKAFAACLEGRGYTVK
ncbi:hypothetical protein JY651_10730 [Pyxidicoccus parkwayensis]|uniref:YMGG-like Gly-zipper domain-containing protein n=1 Tax=Pyxidicoccus parkwayensis TaxID=2813578 RepID=A0ABX7P4F0_9BACT|nr:hypothetical protein [Pyxidicoccus parkwaysis]QSQ25363.1 hypothetical protein JY651_10730 [Pyxidicoccus parkwaysis]